MMPKTNPPPQIKKQQYKHIVGYKVIRTKRHLEKMNVVTSVEGRENGGGDWGLFFALTNLVALVESLNCVHT